MSKPLETEESQFSLAQTKEWFEKNKNLVYGLVVLLVVIIAYSMYSSNKAKTMEAEAAPQMAFPQSYFAADSFQLALDGDGTNLGFRDLVSEYSNTKSGNLASYYAGVCELQLGNYAVAIEYLEDFDAKSELMMAMTHYSLGNAYSMIEDESAAAKNYKIAANNATNSAYAPFFVQKAADYHRVIGKNSEAHKLYLRLQSEYPTSTEAQDAERFIEITKS